MELQLPPPTFALGRCPARRGRSAPSRHGRAPKPRAARSKSYTTAVTITSGPFPPYNSVFALLPASHFHPRIANLLSMTPFNYTDRQTTLESWSKNPFRTMRSRNAPFFKPPTIDPMLRFWSPTVYKLYKAAVEKTSAVRFQLRRFLQAWRFRRLTLANTEDIATCDTPAQPVYVVDWTSKTKYQFEPSTICRDITNRLLNHDGFFDDSLPPRNPFTNIPFTLAQTVSVFRQLQALSHLPDVSISWAITCFKHCSFVMPRFQAEYRIPLQLHALRTTLADHANEDSRERLFDFIEFQHTENGQPFANHSYLHAIVHHPDQPRIVEWRKLCLDYYEAHIKYQHNNQILVNAHNTIQQAAQRWCSRPTELIRLRTSAEANAPEETDPLEEEVNTISIDIHTFFNSLQNAGILLAGAPNAQPNAAPAAVHAEQQQEQVAPAQQVAQAPLQQQPETMPPDDSPENDLQLQILLANLFFPE
jgi:hypothetical protein